MLSTFGGLILISPASEEWQCTHNTPHAISVAKTAVAEGVIPGGELAMLRAIDALENEESKCEGDERTGFQILKWALEIPTRQLA